MHTAVRLLVLVPLLVVACKKKEPEAAPVSAAVAPSVEWTFGAASFVGSESGTLTIPLTVSVHATQAVIIRSWEIGVNTDAGRVCVLHSAGMEKVEAGATSKIDLRGDCDGTRLPASEEIKIGGAIEYATVGGDQQRLDVDQKVALHR